MQMVTANCAEAGGGWARDRGPAQRLERLALSGARALCLCVGVGVAGGLHSAMRLPTSHEANSTAGLAGPATLRKARAEKHVVHTGQSRVLGI